jgi:hypothetical protein
MVAGMSTGTGCHPASRPANGPDSATATDGARTLLSEQPADKRAECGSDIRDSVEGTDCGGPMITGDRVADRRHAYGEQRRGTQALHSPESNQ